MSTLQNQHKVNVSDLQDATVTRIGWLATSPTPLNRIVPTAFNPQLFGGQAVSSHQPATSSQQLGLSSRQTSANNQQPAASGQQPAVQAGGVGPSRPPGDEGRLIEDYP
jgi:hypothetical protein